MKRGFIKMQKNYNIDKGFEKLEINEEHFKKTAWIPPKRAEKLSEKE